jgi:transketolase
MAHTETAGIREETKTGSGPAFDPTALRRTILHMARSGSSVHIACAFSIVEILAVLHRSHLRHYVTPEAAGRDYLVLSKGHGVMAEYACMHELGWLKTQDLDRYFGDGTKLKGLSDASVKGLEVTSGSLGHGLSVGVGLALAARRNGTGQRCFAIVGDGEMNEGAIWEAMLLAAHCGLDNLVVIVDENGLQAMGRTEDVLGLGSLAAKFEAFSFDCEVVDGHAEARIDEAIVRLLGRRNGHPKAIVAKTVKGKGVSFMENNNAWHYTRLDERTFEDAMMELGRA